MSIPYLLFSYSTSRFSRETEREEKKRVFAVRLSQFFFSGRLVRRASELRHHCPENETTRRAKTSSEEDSTPTLSTRGTNRRRDCCSKSHARALASCVPNYQALTEGPGRPAKEINALTRCCSRSLVPCMRYIDYRDFG